MTCIEMFKKAAVAMQTDERYIELDAARRANDADEELQNQQQDDSSTDTGNGGITDEQLRQYLEELLGQQGQGQGQGYGQGF